MNELVCYRKLFTSFEAVFFFKKGGDHSHQMDVKCSCIHKRQCDQPFTEECKHPLERFISL